jgi:Zn finger protein HypA/HybF involved in hydrogenase expression
MTTRARRTAHHRVRVVDLANHKLECVQCRHRWTSAKGCHRCPRCAPAFFSETSATHEENKP